MDLLNLLNPRTFFDSIVKVYRNFANRRFYKKTMLKLEKDGTLKQAGLRLDRRCRAYFVLNLEPEILMMGEEALALEKSRVYEAILAKNRALNSDELIEIIEAKTTRIKDDDYYAYLIEIKYKSLATFSEIFYVFTWLLGAGITVYGLIYGVLHLDGILQFLSKVFNSK